MPQCNVVKYSLNLPYFLWCVHIDTGHSAQTIGIDVHGVIVMYKILFLSCVSPKCVVLFYGY
jgi:hypothetical protein